jgi:hypothetical protein
MPSAGIAEGLSVSSNSLPDFANAFEISGHIADAMNGYQIMQTHAKIWPYLQKG